MKSSSAVRDHTWFRNLILFHQIRYMGHCFFFTVLSVLFYVQVNKQAPILPYVVSRTFCNEICVGAYVCIFSAFRIFYNGFERLQLSVIYPCLLYTSDAADDEDSVDLGGRRT